MELENQGEREKMEEKIQKELFYILFGSRDGDGDSSRPTENKGSALWLTVKGERCGAGVPQLLKAKAHKAPHFYGLHFHLNLWPRTAADIFSFMA